MHIDKQYIKQHASLSPITVTIDPVPWKDIRTLYSMKQPHLKLTGSLINGLVTCDLPCFMLSRSLMTNFILKDPNIKRGTLSGTDYKFLIKYLCDVKLIECLIPASKYGDKIRRGGLFRILASGVREEFKDIEMREQEIVEHYCSIHKLEQIVLKPVNLTDNV